MKKFTASINSKKKLKTQAKKKANDQKSARLHSSLINSDSEYSDSSDYSTNSCSIRVSFSPKVQFKPPREPVNRWLNSLSDEQRRLLSRNQKIVDRYKQTVLVRYGLPENATNKLISRSCIPRKVLIMINQASKNTEVLFRRSTLYTELENIISSDIQEKNTKLANQYIVKFENKFGSIENIPNGKYLKAFEEVCSWKENDECLLPNSETDLLMTILNSL